MSQAEELLSSLVTTASINPDTEPHIIIGEDRSVTVPQELKRIAVQFDHNIETVTFDCPRYWDNHDMSKMTVYINYKCKDGAMGSYIADNLRVDETDDTIMHFDWTISGNVTQVKGELVFLICVKKTEISTSELINHWNSELCVDMYVSEGLECDAVLENSYPDLYTQLLQKIDQNEETALSYMNNTMAYAEAASVSEKNAASSELNAASSAAEAASSAAEAAKGEEAANKAIDMVDDVTEALENGDFIGPQGVQGPQGERGEKGEQGIQGIQGEKGEKGDPGESGIVTAISGFYTLSVDSDGNLWVNSTGDDEAPEFEYDEETGNLYIITED